MGGIHPIRNVLRIDNVETAPAERITANDEDQQRQGFDIQTVFAWPRRDGAIDVTTAVASDEAGPILSLAYAQGAAISRLNKGLRRRKEKSISGSSSTPRLAAGQEARMRGTTRTLPSRGSSALCRLSRITRTLCCSGFPSTRCPKRRSQRFNMRLRAGWSSSSSWKKARFRPSPSRRVIGGGVSFSTKRRKAVPACWRE